MSDESERVKKHNRNKMKQGYKNISFKVSPEEYKEIKKARKHYKMCDRELLMYLVSGQRDGDMVDNLACGFDYNERSNDDEYYQRIHDENGKAHKITGKKDYIVLAYLSIDRKKIKIIEDFDTLDEALKFEESFISKKRTTVFHRVSSNKDWYLSFW